MKRLLISAKRDSVGRCSPLYSSHGLEIHTESLLSQFPRVVSKGCAITVPKCRSCFPLSGLWYYVMESRFCVSAAILAPQTALFQWQAGDKRLKPEALRNKGRTFLWQPSLGKQGICVPLQLSTMAALSSERRGESRVGSPVL